MANTISNLIGIPKIDKNYTGLPSTPPNQSIIVKKPDGTLTGYTPPLPQPSNHRSSNNSNNQTPPMQSIVGLPINQQPQPTQMQSMVKKSLPSQPQPTPDQYYAYYNAPKGYQSGIYTSSGKFYPDVNKDYVPYGNYKKGFIDQRTDGLYILPKDNNFLGQSTKEGITYYQSSKPQPIDVKQELYNLLSPDKFKVVQSKTKLETFLQNNYDKIKDTKIGKILVDVLYGKQNGMETQIVNIVDANGFPTGQTQRVLVKSSPQTYQQRAITNLKKNFVYNLNPKDVQMIKGFGIAGGLALSSGLSMAPKVLSLVGTKNLVYAGSFLGAGKIRQVADPLINLVPFKNKYVRGAEKGVLIMSNPLTSIAYGKGFFTDLIMNPVQTGVGIAQNKQEFIGGLVGGSIYGKLTKPKQNIALKEGELVRYQVKSKASGKKFIVELPYKKSESYTSKDLIQPIILPNGEIFSLGKFELKRVSSPEVSVKGQSILGKLLFSSEQKIGKARTDTITNTDFILTNEAGNIINRPMVKSQRQGAKMQINSLLFGSQVKIENIPFEKLPETSKQNFMRIYENELGRPVNKDLARQIYNRLSKNENNKLSISEVTSKRIARTRVDKNNINLLMYGNRNTITRAGLVTNARLIAENERGQFFDTTSSSLDITMPSKTNRISRSKPIIIKGKTFINKEVDLGSLLGGNKENIVNEVGDMNNVLTRQKSVNAVKKTQNTIASSKQSLIKQLPRVRAPRFKQTNKVSSLGLVTSLVSPINMNRQMTQTKQASQVKQVQANRNIQQTRQVSRYIQKSRQDYRLAEALVNPQKINQQTKQNQVQRQNQVLKQTQNLKQMSSLIFSPTPNRVRPTRPVPNNPMPLISNFTRKERRPIRKTKEVKRKGNRMFEMTPTLANTLTGRRRSKPLRLSQVTGFEVLTI